MGGKAAGSDGGHEATPDMVVYCWEALLAALERRALAVVPTFADGEAPLFVTWTTTEGVPSGADADLRGCIGCLEPIGLHKGLAEYAETSAFRDRRFSPIRDAEVPHLVCEVNLLTRFEEAARWDDWVVGTHGIILEFRHQGRRFSATYLPHVAEQQGWDVVRTVDSLARKAGWQGAVDDALRSIMRVTRYQSSASELSWADFCRQTARQA